MKWGIRSTSNQKANVYEVCPTTEKNEKFWMQTKGLKRLIWKEKKPLILKEGKVEKSI
jgi:hypothetical protein